MARKAAVLGEIPVGAVVVRKGREVGCGFNTVEKKGCQLWHAEAIAIKSACLKLKNWRLNECELFVTLEPCLMCAGLIFSSRIKTIYYILDEPNFGFKSKWGLKPPCELIKIPDTYDYQKIFREFFRALRENKSSQP